MTKLVWQMVALLTIALSACSGDDGRDGEPGAPGTNAVDRGTIAGQVVDSAGAPVAGVAIETTPATSSTSTAADGRFALASIPVGAYTIVAVSPTSGSAQLVTGVAGGV